MKKRNVLITGSSRGIGRSTALLFAQKGFHVFLNSRSSLDKLETLKKEIESSGTGTCEIVAGDVGNPEDIKHIFSQIQKSCDGIDILVNNAGVAHIGLLMDMTDEEWDHIIRTNLSSAFYCCRACIPHMVSQKYGKIINVSSMWGVSGASCEVAYSASKSGLNGLTRALAKELAPSNVQVNALACGVIDTQMNAQLDSEERKALEDEIPAGRFGTPEEAARMIYDLSKAPDYITGQVIGIDGGYL